MGQLSPPLRSWVEATEGPIEHVEELIGGASRNSFILTLRNGSKRFLRVDAGHGPLSGTPFTLAREYAALRHLGRYPLRVPKVFAFSSEHNAMLMEYVEGYTSYQRIGSDDEERILRRELMETVVALQAVDITGMGVFGSVARASMAEVIGTDLALWRELYDTGATIRDPLIDFALGWLPRSVPDPGARPVLVHGDMGPGNFMIRDGHIQVLIDWELVRIGHPFEDIACIIARSLGAPFGAPREHIANYEQLMGRSVDLAELDYGLILVLTRWLVAILMALSRPSALQNVPMLFAFRQLNAKALIDALCRRYGVAGPDEHFNLRGRTPCPMVFRYGDECLAQMAADAALPAADRYRLQGIRNLMAYVESLMDYGPERYEAEECERSAALLNGPSGTTAEEVNERLCRYARSVAPADARSLVRFLRWRSDREQQLMRTSLRERADNIIAY